MAASSPARFVGTILVSHVRDSVVTGLDHTAIAGHAQHLARAISTGGAPQAIASAPAVRGLVAGTARSALVGGLNTILLIAAIVSFAAAVASFLLIRERDFVSGRRTARWR